MTVIRGKSIHPEEAQGYIKFKIGEVDRLTIDQNGGIQWGTAAVAASGTVGAFTAAAGAAALSGSRWDGGSGTTYSIADIVAALKAANILGA